MAAREGWLQLVTEGVAEFSYVLSVLLIQVSTAKWVSSVVAHCGFKGGVASVSNRGGG